MNDKFNLARQKKLADTFHSLHHTGETLILPNAWDAASAKTYEVAGFPAIATTSSGISWTCGYSDGEHIPPLLMLQFIKSITRVVDIPVTADIEGGYYKKDVDKYAQFIDGVLNSGAIGVNLEDSDPDSGTLYDINHLMEYIGVAREVAGERGVHLFINARVDAMVLNSVNRNEKIRICTERAAAYEEAGADGIFVPFVEDIAVIEELKKKIKAPLNVLMNASLKIADLRKLKVERVTVGGKPKMAALNTVKRIAEELKNNEDWQTLYADDPSYEELNSWFK